MNARIAMGSLILGLAVSTAGAGAAEVTPLYVTTDKTEVVRFTGHPINKVSVTSPGIADVHVVSPTEILVSGKSPGVTSLLVFSNGTVARYDVVVHPAPVTPARAALVPAEAHAIQVHRGDQVSQKLFVRDQDRAWIQLGGPKSTPEVPAK